MFIAPHFWAYYSARSVQDARREPFEWVELEQSFCSNVYGDSVCQAVLAPGLQKCFNTISTCQIAANYASSVRTLRFCRQTVRLPNDGNVWFPFLKSAKVKPTSINPGGGNRSASALGTRATLSVTFSDHPTSDRYVDPYAEERISGAAIYGGAGYDPLTRSTFWRKWSARNLYKTNRVIRHCSGYIDEEGNVTDVIRRTFLTTAFSGPTAAGQVSLDAQDILANVQNDKAQAPAASAGKLSANITNVATSATLVPSGIGDDEYPSTGWVRIGEEVCAFTRAGDVLTLTRGQFQTTAEAHSSGDTAQLCLRFVSESPGEIIRTLLVDYAQVPESVIDVAQFATETANYLPRVYSTLITEPVGVKDLLGEISEQMYCYVYYDERLNLVRLRAVRAAGDDAVYPLDEDNLLADSVSIKEQPEQQITRVVINYAPRNYVAKLDEVANYRVTDIYGEFTEELPDRSGGPRIKTINSRWLGSTDGGAAEELGTSLLARYKVPPRRIDFKLDAKDRGLWVSDFVEITTRQVVDAFGEPTPLAAQIIEANEATPGAVFSYVAQQFLFELPSVTPVVQIAADENDINLRTEYDNQFATPPVAGDVIEFYVRPGVVIGSTSTASPALTVGAWPVGVTLLLRNAGTIAGKGGVGGNAFTSYAVVDQTTPGENGGVALAVTYPISLDNTTGIIGGGGGGGGGYGISYLGAPAAIAAGGGGAGREVGAPGTTNKGDSNATQFPGAPGTLYVGGNGAYGNTGGALGEAGRPYANVTWVGGTSPFAKKGGDPGAAITGTSLVTFINPGDIRGAQIP